MFDLYLDMGRAQASKELKAELISNGWEIIHDFGRTMVRISADNFTTELRSFRRYLRHQFGQHDPRAAKYIILACKKPIFRADGKSSGKSLSDHAYLMTEFMEKETCIELKFSDAIPEAEEFDAAVRAFGEHAIQFCAQLILYHLCGETLSLLEVHHTHRKVYRNLLLMQSQTLEAFQYLTDQQTDKDRGIGWG